MTTIRRSQAAILAVQAETLADRRKTATAEINTAIGHARQRYITNIPGQDAIYAAKEAEAAAYLALPTEPETLSAFPFIEAEVGVLAPSATEVAQVWVQMGSYWRVVAAALERLRMSAINAVSLAESDEAIKAIVASFNDQVGKF